MGIWLAIFSRMFSYPSVGVVGNRYWTPTWFLGEREVWPEAGQGGRADILARFPQAP